MQQQTKAVPLDALCLLRFYRFYSGYNMSCVVLMTMFSALEFATFKLLFFFSDVPAEAAPNKDEYQCTVQW